VESIKVHKLNIYPVVKHYLDRLGVYNLFSDHLKDAQTIHLESLCVLVMNIIIGVRPMYQISNWLKEFSDGQSEFGHQANAFTDDRLGEALDILYKSDRESLLTAASAKSIEIFELSTDQIHNDTTTISFSGAYEANNSDETVALQPGYNKDGRPHDKQIIFNLSTTADGHVPILAQLHDGNTNDSDTHRPNWEALRHHLQRTDFLYVADSKVATIDNMRHIDQYGGRFISILPATRKEVRHFKEQLMQTPQSVEWTTIKQHSHSRKKSKLVVYRAANGGTTEEGYALHWIYSSTKAEQENQQRAKKIALLEEKLTELSQKLNRYYLKTETQIQAAIEKILAAQADWFDVQLKSEQTTSRTKIGRGRIGQHSQFKTEIQTTYQLQWSLNESVIEKQQHIDGIFPLVTNTDLSAQQTLDAYKKQPALEKRFYQFKSITKIAPMFLKLPRRIEAMLFLYFIALMVIALMERAMRNNLAQNKTKTLPILPQGMKTERPTLNNIRYFFDQVFFIRMQLTEQTVEYFTKGLTKLHRKLLELLEVPLHLYEIKELNWWKFRPI